MNFCRNSIFILFIDLKNKISNSTILQKKKKILKNKNKDRTQYRYRIIFKNNNFEKKIKYAIQLTFLFLDEIKRSVTYLIAIIYEFNKQNNPNNEKSNIKLLLKFLIKAFREKSNIELTKIFIIEISNLLRRIKNVYKHDNII